MLLKKARGRLTIKIRNATGLPMGTCKSVASTLVARYNSASWTQAENRRKVHESGGVFVMLYRRCDDYPDAAELHGPKGMFLIEDQPSRRRS